MTRIRVRPLFDEVLVQAALHERTPNAPHGHQAKCWNTVAMKINAIYANSPSKFPVLTGTSARLRVSNLVRVAQDTSHREYAKMSDTMKDAITRYVRMSDDAKEKAKGKAKDLAKQAARASVSINTIEPEVHANGSTWELEAIQNGKVIQAIECFIAVQEEREIYNRREHERLRVDVESSRLSSEINRRDICELRHRVRELEEYQRSSNKRVRMHDVEPCSYHRRDHPRREDGLASLHVESAAGSRDAPPTVEEHTPGSQEFSAAKEDTRDFQKFLHVVEANSRVIVETMREQQDDVRKLMAVIKECFVQNKT